MNEAESKEKDIAIIDLYLLLIMIRQASAYGRYRTLYFRNY